MSNRLHVVQEGNHPWYRKGLRFECTRCGKCCSGGPGYTWTSEADIAALAERLNLNELGFTRRYLRFVRGRYALLEDPATFDCIFLKDNKCMVYESRPKQCRTFPWWRDNLESPEAWEEAARYCEGISDKAPLVSYETIQEQLNIQESRL